MLIHIHTHVKGQHSVLKRRIQSNLQIQQVQEADQEELDGNLGRSG